VVIVGLLDEEIGILERTWVVEGDKVKFISMVVLTAGNSSEAWLGREIEEILPNKGSMLMLE